MLDPTFGLDSVLDPDYCNVKRDIGPRVDLVIMSEK